MVNLTAGGFSGGYRKYLAELVPLLRRHPGVDDLAVLAPEAARGVLDPELGVRHWAAGGSKGSIVSMVHSGRPDVVFIPTARYLRVDDVPTVSMVRNMEPLTVPFAGNPPSEAVRNLARAGAALSASWRADRVVAVSEHVRDFLVKRWLIPARRVGVVPHGVGPALSPGETSKPVALSSDRPFFFTAGSIRPARGLEDVLDALRLLRQQGVDIDLVVAGEPDASSMEYHRRLMNRMLESGLKDRVVWPGSLTAAEMGWCFRECRVFVMSSRAEACPNTVLEALGYGCLAVSTDRAPMPEFFADAARYYPAKSAAGLAGAVKGALNLEPSVADEHRARARDRAAMYDWQTTANRTVDELKFALG